MCSEYMCGGYGGGYKPPSREPWYYKILDALVWVIWLFYQPWKYRKKILAVLLLPAMVVTWPWWGYLYYKRAIGP